MLEWIALTVVLPAVQPWYLGFCFFIMIVPLALFSRSYHEEIIKTPGGQELMRKQRKYRPGGNRSHIDKGIEMGVEIEKGQYGLAAKSLTHAAYKFVLVWLLANTLFFGLWIYADAIK